MLASACVCVRARVRAREGYKENKGDLGDRRGGRRWKEEGREGMRNRGGRGESKRKEKTQPEREKGEKTVCVCGGGGLTLTPPPPCLKI